MPASFAYATTHDDSYIAGYAAGVLKQNLKLEMPSLSVRDGVITGTLIKSIELSHYMRLRL
jgi:hypothetical protein